MRRTASVAAAALALLVLIVVLAVGGSSSDYRVAALFDTAKGMVAGQQVKVAGAVVGSVSSVELAAGPKARIVMSVQRRFAPFHANATCTILPEGLISENYVQCNPGSGPALAADATGTPTVPLRQTTVPFSLPDVLNVLSLPTDERIQVLISQLGIGTAGQGAGINALLRRANPALQTSQHVLQILDAQRQQLAGAVGQTDEILTALGQRTTQVRQFVDRAATVTATTAAHRKALGQTVARLPGMLAAVRPGLQALDTAAVNATPLLPELRAAAPSLTGLTTSLPPFAHDAIPALRTLGSAATHGTPAVRLAEPVARKLNATTAPLATLGTQLSQLLVSARDKGALEGILSVIYAFATNTALYDNVSHILTFAVNVAPQCIIGQEGGFDVPGCGHSNTSPDQGQLPLNEPSCGPKSESWEAQRCPTPTPGPLALRRLSGSTTRQLWKAIDTALSGGAVKSSIWDTLGAALGLRALGARPNSPPARPATTPGTTSPALHAAPAPAGQPAGSTRSGSTPSGSAASGSPAPAPATPSSPATTLPGTVQAVTTRLSSLLGYLLK